MSLGVCICCVVGDLVFKLTLDMIGHEKEYEKKNGDKRLLESIISVIGVLIEEWHRRLDDKSSVYMAVGRN